jgi:hypothetical protein
MSGINGIGIGLGDYVTARSIGTDLSGIKYTFSLRARYNPCSKVLGNTSRVIGAAVIGHDNFVFAFVVLIS